MICGIIGSLMNGDPAQQWWFLASAILMTPLPLYRHHALLGVLQVVSLAGAVTGAFVNQEFWQALTPGCFALVGIGWLCQSGKIGERYEWIGIAGVTLLALGYSLKTPSVYFAGGAVLTVYTGWSMAKGDRIATLWFILNLAFTATSAAAWAEEASLLT